MDLAEFLEASFAEDERSLLEGQMHRVQQVFGADIALKRLILRQAQMHSRALEGEYPRPKVPDAALEMRLSVLMGILLEISRAYDADPGAQKSWPAHI